MADLTDDVTPEQREAMEALAEKTTEAAYAAMPAKLRAMIHDDPVTARDLIIEQMTRELLKALHMLYRMQTRCGDCRAAGKQCDACNGERDEVLGLALVAAKLAATRKLIAEVEAARDAEAGNA